MALQVYKHFCKSVITADYYVFLWGLDTREAAPRDDGEILSV